MTPSVDVGSLDARASVVRVVADALAVHLHSTLDGHPPYAAEMDVTSSAPPRDGR